MTSYKMFVTLVSVKIIYLLALVDVRITKLWWNVEIKY